MTGYKFDFPRPKEGCWVIGDDLNVFVCKKPNWLNKKIKKAREK